MKTAGYVEQIYTKGVAEILYFDFDFSAWLADNAQTLPRLTSNSFVVITPAGTAGDLTAGTKVHDLDTGTVRQWVSGGRSGITYRMTCLIMTDDGQEYGELNAWIIEAK